MHRSEQRVSRRSLLRTAVLAVSGWAAAGRSHGGEKAESDSSEGAIDAHVHVWTSDTRRYPLAPGYAKDRMAIASFTPEELFAHARPCGVRAWC